MRSSFRVLILFIVRCLTDDSADDLPSNTIQMDSYQADSPFTDQLIASTNNPVDSPTVYDPFVNAENSGALPGSTTSLNLLVNTNDQVESAAPKNVALVPTDQEVPVEIGDPTLDNTNDHSSSPATSNLIPSKYLAFDWRSPPIDCKPPLLIACCIMDGIMQICEEFFDRLSVGCKKATLKCCGSIDVDFQCVDEVKIEQKDEDVDSVEQVGAGAVGRGGMTEPEWESYKKDREQALQRKREAAERKAREDELRKQQEFYQEEGDKVRNDAKKGPDLGIQLPDILLGVPGSGQDSIWQLGN